MLLLLVLLLLLVVLIVGVSVFTHAFTALIDGCAHIQVFIAFETDRLLHSLESQFVFAFLKEFFAFSMSAALLLLSSECLLIRCVSSFLPVFLR